jgi:protease-4
VIADQEPASADNIVKSLRGIQGRKPRAVVLRINSPGGSPVQAGYVYDEIRRLRAEYPAIKLYAVIADLGLPVLITSPVRRMRSMPTRPAWWVPLA